MSDVTIFLIRKVHNKTIYYLNEYDLRTNQAVWTTKFMSAYHFCDEIRAKKFIDTHLQGRNCDILEQPAMWVI